MFFLSDLLQLYLVYLLVLFCLCEQGNPIKLLHFLFLQLSVAYVFTSSQHMVQYSAGIFFSEYIVPPCHVFVSIHQESLWDIQILGDLQFLRICHKTNILGQHFGLVVSGKKVLILSSHYKTFSCCFQACTTQPLIGVSFVCISVLTSQLVLSMQRFVFPVLFDLLESFCFVCFLNISCLLRRGVCVFFILVYVQFLFKLIKSFTYRVSFFCFAMCENQLQHLICSCCKVFMLTSS